MLTVKEQNNYELELEDGGDEIIVKVKDLLHGNLLFINKFTGQVNLAYYVNPCIGLELDEIGCLKIGD